MWSETIRATPVPAVSAVPAGVCQSSHEVISRHQLRRGAPREPSLTQFGAAPACALPLQAGSNFSQQLFTRHPQGHCRLSSDRACDVCRKCDAELPRLCGEEPASSFLEAEWFHE